MNNRENNKIGKLLIRLTRIKIGKIQINIKSEMKEGNDNPFHRNKEVYESTVNN